MSPVLVGVQSRYYDSAATASLFYPATDFTPTGTSTKVAGATGAFGAGSNVVRNTDLTTTYQAVLRSEVDATNAALTHKGDFRIWARIYRPLNPGAMSVCLEWGEGDYRKVTRNDPVVFAVPNEFAEKWLLIDLGMVHISPDSTRWEFRLLAKSTAAGDELDTNWFGLFPTTEKGYSESSALPRFEIPSAFVGRDEFNQSAGALGGKQMPIPAGAPGVWATSGSATDLTVGSGVVTRSTVSDASGPRLALAGTTSSAAVAVQMDVDFSTNGAGIHYLIARYVDANNFLQVEFNATAVGVGKVIGGSLFDLPSFPTAYDRTVNSTCRLVVDAGGRFFLWRFPQGTQPGEPFLIGQDDALATGGALATGKVGFQDWNGTAVACTRAYRNFLVFVPTPDAAIFATQSLELRHDRVRREDPTGAFWGPLSSFRGNYLKLAPAGAEGRSNRLIIKASRGPTVRPGVVLDPATDDLSAQLFATPRGLVVPEA